MEQPTTARIELKQVPAAHGWLWIQQGFALFKKSPVLWMVLTIIAVLALIGIASIPVVGDPLATILLPVLLGGFMLGCHALQQNEELELAHLFAGFRTHTHQLVTLGGVNLVGQLLIVGVMMVTGGEQLAGIFMSGKPVEDPQVLSQALEGAGFSVLLAMSLYAVLVMAMQFAPAQVLFNQAAPADAIKNSLRACVRNLMPLSVYGAIMLLFALVASMPMMLGWLVLLPVMIATMYTAYRDLFSAAEPAAPAKSEEPSAF